MFACPFLMCQGSFSLHHQHTCNKNKDFPPSLWQSLSSTRFCNAWGYKSFSEIETINKQHTFTKASIHTTTPYLLSSPSHGIDVLPSSLRRPQLCNFFKICTVYKNVVKLRPCQKTVDIHQHQGPSTPINQLLL